MRRQVMFFTAGLAAACLWTGTALASSPSGSGYPTDENWNYSVACGNGERVDSPDGTSVFVYDGANGTEVCFQQRDADGYETGPLSGRIWASDGMVHADAPTGVAIPFVDLGNGDRTELDTDGETIWVTELNGDSGYGTGWGRTTIEPLEGRISGQHAGGSDYGYGWGTSDTRIGPDGYHSESSSSESGYDEYRTSSNETSVGADGVHYHDSDDYYAGYYYFEMHSTDVDVDGDGVVVSKGDVTGDSFEGYIIAITPSNGVIVNRHTAGFDGCYQYGATDQGVSWNPAGAPGSLPTVVNSDDHPPCE